MIKLSPLIFDHLEFISLVNVRFVEVLPFLPGRDDHNLGVFFNIDISCRSLFSFSSTSGAFSLQALMVKSSAYMSTLLIKRPRVCVSK